MSLSDHLLAAVKDFSTRHGMPPGDSRTLEAFCAHHALLSRNVTAFAAEKLWGSEKLILVGGTADIQIDALAIILNGQIIRPEDEDSVLNSLLSISEAVDIEFIFVQATGNKRAVETLTHKIAEFTDGVANFLVSKPEEAQGMSETLRKWVQLRERILGMLEERDLDYHASCHMYFMYPTEFQVNDDVKRKERDATRKILKDEDLKKIFSSAKLYFINKSRLERMANLGERIAHSFSFSRENFTEMKNLPIGTTCLAGFITLKTLIELISEPDSTDEPLLRSTIFDKNVRGYQGAGSPVNKSIRKTLQDPQERKLFGVLSNGIAIVADSLDFRANGQLRVSGIQIVNGCQTCNTIFEEKEGLSYDDLESMQIAVRIVTTSSDARKDSIILSLNRQTPIVEAQLFTERSFVERLADHLSKPAKPGRSKVFLERQAGEYKNNKDINKLRVLSLEELARAYVGTFFHEVLHKDNLPEQREINKLIRLGQLCQDADPLEPYEFSARCLMSAEQTIRRRHKKYPSWHQFPLKSLMLTSMRHIAERRSGLQLTSYKLNQLPTAKVAIELLEQLDYHKTGESLSDIAIQQIHAASASTGKAINVKSKNDDVLWSATINRIKKL